MVLLSWSGGDYFNTKDMELAVTTSMEFMELVAITTSIIIQELVDIITSTKAIELVVTTSMEVMGLVVTTSTVILELVVTSFSFDTSMRPIFFILFSYLHKKVSGDVLGQSDPSLHPPRPCRSP